VLLFHHGVDVGFFQVAECKFGGLPAQEFTGGPDYIDGIGGLTGGVGHAESLSNPLRVRYTPFRKRHYPHKH
jgi:hypothetical protein